jgi:hypothetical protein
MQTITVRQLVEQLRTMPQDSPVRVWLPGSTISLGGAFQHREFVAITADATAGRCGTATVGKKRNDHDELMQASRQWATRPDDERFTSLDALLAHTRHQREISKGVSMPSRALQARTADRR